MNTLFIGVGSSTAEGIGAMHFRTTLDNGRPLDIIVPGALCVPSTSDSAKQNPIKWISHTTSPKCQPIFSSGPGELKNHMLQQGGWS